MRATVDRAGLDPQGRLPKVQIRRVRKGDLSRVRDVFEQSFGDFLERQLGTRPRQAFNGAQYVHHRWLMEPWGCFVAEEDGSKLVGAALAVTWGTVGLLGPVAVLTHYHNQGIAQQLIRAVEEFFEENKATLHGCVSYRDQRQAPGHLPQVRLPAQVAAGGDEPRAGAPGHPLGAAAPAARHADGATVLRARGDEEEGRAAAIPPDHQRASARGWTWPRKSRSSTVWRWATRCCSSAAPTWPASPSTTPPA